MRVAKMSGWDRKRVMALISRELLPLTKARFPNRPITARDIRRRLERGTTYTVKSAWGNVFGFVHLIKHRRDLWVDMIAVDRTRQRKGAGKRLLAQAEQAAKSYNVSRIRLFVDVSNRKAILFYLAHGYTFTLHHPQIYCYELCKDI